MFVDDSREHVRYETYVSSASTTSFDLHVRTWDDSRINRMMQPGSPAEFCEDLSMGIIAFVLTNISLCTRKTS